MRTKAPRKTSVADHRRTTPDSESLRRLAPRSHLREPVVQNVEGPKAGDIGTDIGTGSSSQIGADGAVEKQSSDLQGGVDGNNVYLTPNEMTLPPTVAWPVGVVVERVCGPVVATAPYDDGDDRGVARRIVT